jgi:two-component system, OmpR family, sensor histidine kinase SenX3
VIAVDVLVGALAFGAGAGGGVIFARRLRSPKPPVVAPAAVVADDAAGPPTPQPAPAPQPLAPLVVAALAQGVVVLDREERAVLVNPAARAMGVLDVDRLAFPLLIDVARRSMDGGWPVAATVDLPIGRLGREPIALAVTAVPLRWGDDRVYAVALLLADVSEQRRLEAVRRDFVANVSHELKTPVGALMLLAEAVQDASDDPEAVARFAGRMQREGARLSRLVRELIELSRVQGADPMPGASCITVESILDEAVDRTRLAAEQMGTTVVVRCAPSLVVRGNEAQLATAVANLIENAIAYSGSGTRVSVIAAPATDADAHPCVDVEVTDQGVGIADADLDRIFERFYRVDPARSRATGGTGLGLAIVKNIVSNHLGTVAVRSHEGQGSTFTIRLPRVHSDGSSSRPRARDNPMRSAPVTTRGTA